MRSSTQGADICLTVTVHTRDWGVIGEQQCCLHSASKQQAGPSTQQWNGGQCCRDLRKSPFLCFQRAAI